MFFEKGENKKKKKKTCLAWNNMKLFEMKDTIIFFI